MSLYAKWHHVAYTYSIYERGFCDFVQRLFLATILITNKLEQRGSIKFCTKFSNPSAKTVEMLCLPFGKLSSGRTQAFEQHVHFKAGQVTDWFQDDKYSGKPTRSKVSDVEKSHDLFLN